MAMKQNGKFESRNVTTSAYKAKLFVEEQVSQIKLKLIAAMRSKCTASVTIILPKSVQNMKYGTIQFLIKDGHQSAILKSRIAIFELILPFVPKIM